MMYTIKLEEKATGREITRDFELDNQVVDFDDVNNYFGLGQILYNMKKTLQDSKEDF
ncbi:MAG: hypothetical protein ABIJ17_01055 [Patescibacteria group bacterium]